jgi:hypothetical protein
MAYVNEAAKLTLILGVVAACLTSAWWVPAARDMVTPKVMPRVELMYHGDAIDSFDDFADCVNVLPVGSQWACIAR